MKDRTELSRDNLNYLIAHVDHFLWKTWDPIGNGQLGLPRNEYSGYTSAVVDVLIDYPNETDVARILSRFASVNMGMNSKLEDELPYARELLRINRNETLPKTDLTFVNQELENSLAQYFESNGFPTVLYYLVNDSAKREEPVALEMFQERWQQIVDRGYPEITLKPFGYDQGAFVVSVVYDEKRPYFCPRGMSRIVMDTEEILSRGRIEWKN